ncbi:MAG: dTDP-4-dehydrorhamnose reductase [Acidimicrobiales bacterium]
MSGGGAVPGGRGSVVVTGAGGRLAAALVPALEGDGWRVHPATRSELDLEDPAAPARVLDAARPDVVVNLAAWTDVDACEADEARAHAINATGVGHLRRAAGAVDAHLVHVSTDYVFDGGADEPCDEAVAPRPINAYGRSKLAGEVAAGPDASIVRVAWVSGAHGRSLVRTAVDAALGRSAEATFVTDRWGSPSRADDVAAVLARVVDRRPGGVLHVANAGEATPYELACAAAELAGGEPGRIVPASSTDHVRAGRAPRPRRSALRSSRLGPELGVQMRGWREALADLVPQLVDEGGR